MLTIPKLLTDAIEKVFFRAATVSRVKSLSEHLQFIEISGEKLKGVAWSPGQIVQFKIGNLALRAYTPIRWNPAMGTAEFIIVLHGQGPGSQWALSVKEGDSCNFIGPKYATNLATTDRSVILFGDETSFATAKAFEDSNTGRCQNSYIFEVSDTAESESVLRQLELSSSYLIQKTRDRKHLVEVATTVSILAQKSQGSSYVFTGEALSIQRVRKLLREQNLPMPQVTTKPYWSPGRSGMD